MKFCYRGSAYLSYARSLDQTLGQDVNVASMIVVMFSCDPNLSIV